MIKLFLYLVIAYLVYKLYIDVKKINPPRDNQKNLHDKNKKEEYTDYEEIE
jgi:hypothetical protein